MNQNDAQDKLNELGLEAYDRELHGRFAPENSADAGSRGEVAGVESDGPTDEEIAFCRAVDRMLCGRPPISSERRRSRIIAMLRKYTNRRLRITMLGENGNWWVYSTSVADHGILVKNRSNGQLAVVRDPTPDEWAMAFHAPSHPYRWLEPERLIIDPATTPPPTV